MAMNWPTFFTRLGSAIVFAAVMMCGLLWKDWMFVVLVGVTMVLCLREYFRVITLINGRVFPWAVKGVIWLVAFMIISCIAVAHASEYYLPLIQSPPDDDIIGALVIAALVIASVALLLLFGLLALLCSGTKRRQYLQALGAFGYIILPLFLLWLLRLDAWHLPLILILCIWMNDTMAYIVGSFIGKTPFSKISPKKTWEGTIGGALLTVVGAAVAAHFIPHQSMPLYIALALCAAIAGTAGDLFESKLKRMAGVKDSGTLMPGHGGALDRFDSLLVATPFAFCAVYFIQAFST